MEIYFIFTYSLDSYLPFFARRQANEHNKGFSNSVVELKGDSSAKCHGP